MMFSCPKDGCKGYILISSPASGRGFCNFCKTIYEVQLKEIGKLKRLEGAWPPQTAEGIGEWP